MKRIFYFVIAIHFSALLWMALWLPTKKLKKKPLEVRTVVYMPPPPPKIVEIKPKKMPAPIKKKKPTARKKPKAKKQPALVKKKKEPKVPDQLRQDLQNSIAKLTKKRDKDSSKNTLQVPKWTPQLKVEQVGTSDVAVFTSALIACLQNALDLPERGAVKVKLTLKKEGKFVKMHLISSESALNSKFLEREIPVVSYPSFSGQLKQEKEHTFVITFCNH